MTENEFYFSGKYGSKLCFIISICLSVMHLLGSTYIVSFFRIIMNILSFSSTSIPPSANSTVLGGIG